MCFRIAVARPLANGRADVSGRQFALPLRATGSVAEAPVPGTELGLRAEPAQLAVLLLYGGDQVGHADRVAAVGGRVAGGQRDRADVAAGELEGLGAEVEVDVWCARRAASEAEIPQPPPAVRVRRLEVDDRVEPARERVVDV